MASFRDSLLKESRISVWRNYENNLYIDLIQIVFCQQSVLESILFVAELNNCNKTNITLSSGLYENKKYKNQFANVHFICSITASKASNIHISNQNLSETTQNHAWHIQW